MIFYAPCFRVTTILARRHPWLVEMLLTLRLAKDGVKMGLRNDARITAVGLTASLTDVLEKMDDYLAVVDG